MSQPIIFNFVTSGSSRILLKYFIFTSSRILKLDKLILRKKLREFYGYLGYVCLLLCICTLDE